MGKWELNFGRKRLKRGMKNVMPAFEFQDDNIVPIGYKKIDCHVIFDGNMDLRRKAGLVTGGHQTKVLTVI
jgi:hypothetical protein